MALCLAGRLVSKHRLIYLLDQGHAKFNDKGVTHLIGSVRMKATEPVRKTTTQQTDTGKPGKELDLARENPYAGMTMGQKVKEAGKDASYLGISLAALGVLGAMIYYVGRELFAGDSSNGVYTKAFKKCVKDSEIIIALGQPIKAYGEETRRGRRSHVSHLEFEQNGKKHMRMKFHIQGSDKKGEVNLEVVKNDSGKYDYRYLFVQLEHYPYRTLVLEDNR